MESIVKMKRGKCRFCNATGNHREIMTEYNFEGVREIYFDVLQECFNLYIQINPNKSSLICCRCVERLRDAVSFRTLVVNAELQLNDVLDDKHTVFVNTGKTHIDLEVKTEDVKEEDLYERDQHETHGNDGIQFPGDYVNGEIELLSRFSDLRPLPSRSDLKHICRRYYRELELLKDKNVTAKSIGNLIPDRNSHRINTKVYVTEKMAHIANVATILENSNLTAFKTRRRSGFPCFYCGRTFESFDVLTEHQLEGRCKDNIRKIISKCPSESLAVYVHVTEIRCSICETVLPNMIELKQHLVRVHDKKMYPGYGDRVIPFKMSPDNGYECQVCGFAFETFGAVERHMSVHYRNYVCRRCGAGYVTRNRLKVHSRSAHTDGVFPCDVCDKTFNTRYKYKSHVDVVHRMIKRNKCPKCPERFTDYFDRHKHMTDAHGEAPLRYRCRVCEAPFKRRYALSCHMKRRHLEAREVFCNLCPYQCYTGTELRAHMVKHGGERSHECSVCKKRYARKKTLKEHMRIHNNDRRFVCVVCGQAFVQNCSLKGHMKSHHMEHLNGPPR